MKQMIKLFNIGKIDYVPALKLQKYFVDLHLSGFKTPNTILFVEHSPVYTIGIRSTEYSTEYECRLKQTGAEFYRTNRGGLITFHGPGQFVVYPILNLKHFNIGMRSYVCKLEQTVIKVCQEYGLNAETSERTGVWIGNNKICAIGIHGQRFITSHGLALNCTVDLNWYKHIIPCGIKDKGVTSLSKELNKSVTISEVTPIFVNKFQEVFHCSINNCSENETSKILSSIST